MATFKRPSRKPLAFWSDKLSRLEIHKTLRTKIFLNNVPIKVKVWFGKNMQGKDTMITALWVEHPRKLVPSLSLTNTDFGLICPTCNTNEFLKYRMPADKDAGMSCEVCHACSPYRPGGNPDA